MIKKNIGKKILLPIFIIACIIFIFFNSSLNGGQSLEGSTSITRAIEKVVDLIYKGDTPEKISNFFKTTFNYIFRDIAHVFEFLVLGILTMLYSYAVFKVSILKKFFFTLFFCILIAFIDEIIQFFSPGRAFEFYDLALDGLGSIIGILLIFLIYKKRKQIKT